MKSYRVQPTILATEERSLYHALTLVVAQRALLLSKVKLSAMLEPVAHPTSSYGVAASPVNLERYTADFVLCDRHTTQPLCVILVDSCTSPRCSQGESSNNFMQELCENADLPVLRLPQATAYRMDKLMRLIEPVLAGAGQHQDYQENNAAQEQRIAVPIDHEKPVIPRPGTLFSRN